MPIEFVGFTTEHRIAGVVPLADDRLSDMLNGVVRVVVRSASTTALDGGKVVAGDVTIACRDLLVVGGTGRRGIESQRRRTQTRRVRLGIGRYVVEGLVHVVPGASSPRIDGPAAELFAGRDLLVPLTDAVLTWEQGRTSAEERWECVLVNRARAAWIEAADEGPHLIDDEPGGGTGRLGRAKYAKDFTGTPSA